MSWLSNLNFWLRSLPGNQVFLSWYLKNRFRTLLLAGEQKRPDGSSRFPRCITLKPTLCCNLQCEMCHYASSGDVNRNPNDTMPLEAWKRIIDDVSSFRPYIILTGGEPTLYRGTTELIAYIKSRGLVCSMTTNGTLLSTYAEELMSNPPDLLAVSIDGPKEIHNGIRGRSWAFDRTMDGLSLLHAIKKKRRKVKPFLVITCAITASSYPYIHQIVDIAREVGAGALNFQHQWFLTRQMCDAHNALWGQVHPVSYEECGGIEPTQIDARAVSEAVGNIRRLGKVIDNKIRILFQPELNADEVLDWYSDPHRWVKRLTPACAWMVAEIRPNGDVEICPQMIVGNLVESRFADIWNLPHIKEHRKRLSSEGDIPICVRCCRYFRRD